MKIIGLWADVLRPTHGSDSSNGGPSSTRSKVFLSGVPGGLEYDKEGIDPEAVFRLVRRAFPFGAEYVTAEPTIETRGHRMFGGNFLYSSDSRFRQICGYPIPIHDREEGVK